MREGIHLDHRPVVFRDRAANHAFLTLDTAGRVERFARRYGKGGA
ncbi:hypothetical protein ACIBSR_28120 [Streptomyces sp. NPDC049936]